MRCEVIAVGTELLLGQIVDTNSSWMGEHLALAGIASHFQTKVGDNMERMIACIRLGLERSDAVILCGGLGPTQDDITREAIAEVMGVGLVRQPEIGERIRAIIVDVKTVGQRVKIIISRTREELVAKLFELEVPEVSEGSVVIRAIEREAGFRTKVAVQSVDARVDCVGACVGVRGSRIKNVVDEFNGERIDIVRWNDSVEVLIINALRPAEISSITLDYDARKIKIIKVLREQYQIAGETYQGMVAIQTIDGIYAQEWASDSGDRFSYLTPIPRKRYYRQSAKTGHIPDYRGQLLWEPDIELETEGKSFTFYTSQVPGTYEIVLEGYTSYGKPVSLKSTITVVNAQ